MTDDFEAPRKLCAALNRLHKLDPEQAEAIADTDLLKLLNEEYRQGFGPIVARWEEFVVDGQPQDKQLAGFDLFMGARLSDKELARVEEVIDSGEVSFVRV